jgi:hypothetical protein
MGEASRPHPFNTLQFHFFESRQLYTHLLALGDGGAALSIRRVAQSTHHLACPWPQERNADYQAGVIGLCYVAHKDFMFINFLRMCTKDYEQD